MVENCLSGYNSCMFAYGQVNISLESGEDFVFFYCSLLCMSCYVFL